MVGKVNNITFDSNHVMLRNEGQIISGTKSIYTAEFKNIDLIGYLNGVNISELLRRQVCKTIFFASRKLKNLFLAIR